MAGTSRRPHVVTSQRCDVESTYIEVNSGNVAMSQRRDVSMSRRQRDLFLSIIKSKRGDQNSRGGSEIKDVQTRALRS